MLKRPTIILIRPQESNEATVQIEDNQREDDQIVSKQEGCNCQRSKCVKLYCPCFHKGQECGDQCFCVECNNSALKSEQRRDAIFKIIKKYKSNYVQKFQKEKVEGCQCIKSKCRMNYCECYIRGQECDDKCGCKKCLNGKISLKVKRVRVKKQINNEKIENESYI